MNLLSVEHCIFNYSGVIADVLTLKVEERKQFGSATVRGELPLEAQLQAEQEAVDRKEKEVEYPFQLFRYFSILYESLELNILWMQWAQG